MLFHSTTLHPTPKHHFCSPTPPTNKPPNGKENEKHTQKLKLERKSCNNHSSDIMQLSEFLTSHDHNNNTQGKALGFNNTSETSFFSHFLKQGITIYNSHPWFNIQKHGITTLAPCHGLASPLEKLENIEDNRPTKAQMRTPTKDEDIQVT